MWTPWRKHGHKSCRSISGAEGPWFAGHVAVLLLCMFLMTLFHFVSLFHSLCVAACGVIREIVDGLLCFFSMIFMISGLIVVVHDRVNLTSSVLSFKFPLE